MLSMKPSLNLRQIEAFRCVMVSGSMVGAARLMNVTQPGVSRTISLMELRLGYRLFERRGRRVVPTPEAEALYREVEPLYASVDRIAQVAQDIRFQRAGALRVATLPALAQWLVPQAVSRFLAERPKVTVFLQSLPSRQIAEMVSTRQFDLGVVELPVSRPGIEIEPLPMAESMLLMPAGHRLAAFDRVSLRELDGEPMILLSQHSYLRYQIDEAFSSVGVAPRVVVETPSSSIAGAMVAAGAGLTLVSRWTAMPFAGPDVVVRPVAESLGSRTALIHPGMPTPAPIPLARAFGEQLRAMMEATVDLGGQGDDRTSATSPARG
jgi:DNA-binding transcriptional LysR family regulator